MEAGNKIIYDAQSGGNILAVGRTGCGKPYFLHKLAINKFFGELVKIEWVRGIDIDKRREAEIESCFNNKVQFHRNIQEPDDLTNLLETFKLHTSDKSDNVNNTAFGEIISMDHLIVMDDVSGVADDCKKFAEFLTVCRKYRYHCICVFHVIAPETQIWKKTLSQANIFNIFRSSVPYNTISKILQSNCSQTRKKYIPARSV